MESEHRTCIWGYILFVRIHKDKVVQDMRQKFQPFQLVYRVLANRLYGRPSKQNRHT